eukprot:CAMPEP_0119481752 /NCGR_PEP_ID=MMETSP1344-20130328/9936_1 /TAXON_ID=236787 /ORGANISM="Florenciella parvula, Strain CCMP2471" /LENGTH=1560 /DNA_ID=CAMNT_0007516129 /DNA_START=105 /DNA_END=4787 /DNA_ORIENTATION=+
MDHSTNWTNDDAGGLCWVSDPTQAYIEAVFKGISGNIATVETVQGQTMEIDIQAPLAGPSRKQKEPPRRLLQRVPVESIALNGVEDMDNLPSLHEASILSNVDLRFRMDKIYTNSGPILIAMNPFKWLPIYGEEVIKSYHNRPYGSQAPHCFMEAEDAYQQLIKTQLNQAVVICGESGAGKTETTKLMLQYLSVISKRYEGGSAADGMTMGEKIVESNPLMEAFGNAKTLRNNNSSRFGKFTALHYSPQHTITGCHITNLLLEKARIVHQAEGERNFHIFYQLQAGAAAKYGLNGGATSQEYTKVCTTVSDMNDTEEYGLTVKSMKAVDIADAEIDSVMKIVAGVLQLGNVKFTNSDNSAVDGASSGALNAAAGMLGVSASKLQHALVHRVREIAGEAPVASPNNQEQSVHLRDATSKSVYSKLFDWLVTRINMTLDVDSASNPKFIGILDIFGFEDMRVNGFEQLFINTTNEMLQKVFNDIIFKKEEEEYNREQIVWDKTVFPDNDPCIHMLTKRPIGLLPYLDSECQRGMAASEGEALVRKFNQSHGNHKFYEVCGPASVWRRKDGKRTQNEDFLVHHFAGPIIYTVSDFIDKNRDALYGHVHDVLSESTNPLVASLYPQRTEEDNVASSKMTVGNRFLSQLQQLVGMLRASETRFVRCIKTNETFSPSVVDKTSVLRQLVCSGVMAALEVRRAGFPSRMLFTEFVREFRCFSGKPPYPSNDKDLTAKMMKHPSVAGRVTEAQYRLGTTKLFMQADVLYTLQSIKNKAIEPYVRRLQRWWIKNQGQIQQHKLKRGTYMIARLTEKAKTEGVHHVAFVQKILAAADAARLTAAGNLNRENVSALLDLCETAEANVDKAVQQKAEAYRIRAEILGVLDGFSARLEAVKAEAATLYNPEAKALLTSECDAAEMALTSCREEQTAAANAWDQAVMADTGEQTGGLRRAATRANLYASASKVKMGNASAQEQAAARDGRMAEAKSMVPPLEELCARLLEEKRLMDAARAQYADAIDQASYRLDTIPVDQYIMFGITNVSDAVAEARMGIDQAHKMLNSMDPEGFKAAVKYAAEAVEKAIHKAIHESSRMQAMSDLDEGDKVLRDVYEMAATENVLEVPGFQGLCSSAQQDIANARAQCMIPDVHTLQASVEIALSSVEACHDAYQHNFVAKRRADRDKFNAVKNMWEGKANDNPEVPSANRRASGSGKALFKVKAAAMPELPTAAEKGQLFKREQKAPVFSAAAPSSLPDVSGLSGGGAAEVEPIPAAEFHTHVDGEGRVLEDVTDADRASDMEYVAKMAEAGSLGEWIDANGLSSYKEQICSYAAELHDLVEMTDEDVDELISESAMPKLAGRRLKKAISELAGAQVSRPVGDSNLGVSENAPGIAMEPPQYVLEELNEAPPAPTEEEYEADYAAAAAVAPPAAPSPYSFADDTPSSVADAAPAFDATEEPVAATGISSKFSDAAKVIVVNDDFTKYVETVGSDGDTAIGYRNTGPKPFSLTIDFGASTNTMVKEHEGNATPSDLRVTQVVQPNGMMVVVVGAADLAAGTYQYKMSMEGESL